MLSLSRRAGKSATQQDPEPIGTDDPRPFAQRISRIGVRRLGTDQAEIPVICVHGLTRQGRDFDYLAAYLAATGRRVVCSISSGAAGVAV